MRRFAVLAAVVAVLAAAAFTLTPAPVSFASPAHRACTTECVYYQGYTGQPGWFQAKWTTNANGWYVRGVAKCGNGTRNTILKEGGWVKSVGLYSRATCTSSYPDLAGAAYDTKNCSTCSFTRTWVSIPARIH